MQRREPEFITFEKNILTIQCPKGFDAKEEKIKLDQLEKFLQETFLEKNEFLKTRLGKFKHFSSLRIDLISVTHRMLALLEKYCDPSILTIYSWRGKFSELHINFKNIEYLLIDRVNFEKITFNTLSRLQKLGLTNLPNLKYFANTGLGVLPPSAWECPNLNFLKLKNNPKLTTMLKGVWGERLHLEVDFDLSVHSLTYDKLQIETCDLTVHFSIYHAEKQLQIKEQKRQQFDEKLRIEQQKREQLRLDQGVNRQIKDMDDMLQRLQQSSIKKDKKVDNTSPLVIASKLTNEQCETMRILSHFNQKEGLKMIEMLSLLEKNASNLPALQQLINLTTSSDDKARLINKISELVSTETDLMISASFPKHVDKENISAYVLKQINDITESLIKLEKSISSIPVLPDLPETKAEQETINTHPKSSELIKYQKRWKKDYRI